jgi:hypothetical protein
MEFPLTIQYKRRAERQMWQGAWLRGCDASLGMTASEEVQ